MSPKTNPVQSDHFAGFFYAFFPNFPCLSLFFLNFPCFISFLCFSALLLVTFSPSHFLFLSLSVKETWLPLKQADSSAFSCRRCTFWCWRQPCSLLSSAPGPTPHRLHGSCTWKHKGSRYQYSKPCFHSSDVSTQMLTLPAPFPSLSPDLSCVAPQTLWQLQSMNQENNYIQFLIQTQTNRYKCNMSSCLKWGIFFKKPIKCFMIKEHLNTRVPPENLIIPLVL